MLIVVDAPCSWYIYTANLKTLLRRFDLHFTRTVPLEHRIAIQCRESTNHHPMLQVDCSKEPETVLQPNMASRASANGCNRDETEALYSVCISILYIVRWLAYLLVGVQQCSVACLTHKVMSCVRRQRGVTVCAVVHF